MDKKEIIKTLDRTKINRVVFKFPELISDNAEQLIKDSYSELLSIEQQLLKTRDEVLRLETLYKEKKKEFDEKSSLFELEFATLEKEHTTHTSKIMFKGMGNDIIGRPRVY